MKSIIRNLITVCFACFAFVLMCDTTYAAQITVTDELGNTEVILEIDEEQLQVFADTPIVMTADDPPSPGLVAKQVNGLADYVYDYQFPKVCNFFFLDLGPNWSEVIDDDSELYSFGRYIYLFYGLYCPECDAVCNGDNLHWTGSELFESTVGTTVSENIIEVRGPYALVSYNATSDQVKEIQNTYTETNANWTKIELEGFTPDSDTVNVGYYPRVTAFAHDELNSVTLCGLELDATYNWSNFSWNSSWTGVVDDSMSTDFNFWDNLVSGDWTADNWLTQLFGTALQSMAELLNMIQNLPDLFNVVISGFPEEIAGFFALIVGIFVTVVIMKIAIMVVK